MWGPMMGAAQYFRLEEQKAEKITTKVPQKFLNVDHLTFDTPHLVLAKQ